MTAATTRLPGLTPDQIMTTLGITNGTARADAAAGVGDPDTGWDGEPVPLTTDRLLRPFPVDALPGWVGEMVAAVAEATQTPVDLPASVALACLSTAAGGRALVQAARSWVEPVNLYTVVALPPGSRKSPVFRAMTAPIAAAETALQEQTRPQQIEAALAARVAQAKAETAARAAETATVDPGEAMADAVSTAEQAAAIVVPELPRLTTDDVTPESCVTLLAKHGGRIAVLSAEGDAFATLTGTRYSTSANLGVFLKGHGGDKLQVDRKGRDAESIDRPALTIGITTQPGTLAGLAAQPGFRDRGVPARILYSLPENTLGRRKIDPDPVPEHVEHTYTDQLATMILSLAALDEPVTLHLTGEARDVLSGVLAWIEPQLDPHGGHFAGIADWAGKWAGHIVRIAGLLHLADNLRTGYADPIGEDTMRAAETIGRYYLDHALAVFDLMGTTSPELDDARHVLAWITRTGADQFTRRGLFNAVRNTSRFTRATDVDPALELLIEHGYIRPRPAEHNPKGGRPSQTYDVHPAAHTTSRAKPAEPAKP